MPCAHNSETHCQTDHHLRGSLFPSFLPSLQCIALSDICILFHQIRCQTRLLRLRHRIGETDTDSTQKYSKMSFVLFLFSVQGSHMSGHLLALISCYLLKTVIQERLPTIYTIEDQCECPRNRISGFQLTKVRVRSVVCLSFAFALCLALFQSYCRKTFIA